MTRSSAWLALLLVSCGGAELRGAIGVAAGQAPVGERRGRFLPRDCEDGRGQPAPAPPVEIRVVRLVDGRDLLFESRPGHDSLIVTNRFERTGRSFFQFSSRSEDGPELLHERSFAGRTGVAGSLIIADRFAAESTPWGFRASARRVVLRCDLASAPYPDLDTTAGLE